MNVVLLTFLKTAFLNSPMTKVGLGENHSSGGVRVQVGSESAVITSLCLEFLGELVDKDNSVAKAVSNINDAMGDLKKAVEDLGR